MKAIAVKRFEALDAFRGLSAVMIILYHSRFYQSDAPLRFIQNGNIFVDFFFILSGFVMAHSYGRRILEGLGFKKFVLLRLARLYPLQLFTLLLWVPFVVVKYSLYGQGGGDPAEAHGLLTFAQNLLLLQGFSTTTSWNYPSWSIGVEFYTYLLFFAAVLLTKAFPPALKTAFVAGIVLAGYALFDHYYGDEYAMKNMLRCVSEFFLGVLIYRLYELKPLRMTNAAAVLLFELVLVAAIYYAVSHIQQAPLFRHATIALFTLTVYLFAVQERGYLAKLLSTKPLQHLGKISYSVYMTHAILIVVFYEALVRFFGLEATEIEGVRRSLVFDYAWLANALLVAVVVLCSTLTYRYVEAAGQRFIKTRTAG